MPDSILSRLQQTRRQQLESQEVVSVENTLEGLKAELAKYPETRRHSAIVLDKALDQKLTQFCKDRSITVEVFLEAAWTTAIETPELLEAIATEAKRRYISRKQAGRLRRLITMLEFPNERD
jgi:hypothetical protein